jgi:ADP-L-glycero-D-manno-heptose 6-epimerase
MAPGIYNVGSGVARTFNEKASAMFALLGRPPRIDYVELPEPLRGKYQYHTHATLERLRGAGHAAPATSLEDGLECYVHGFLATANRHR